MGPVLRDVILFFSLKSCRMIRSFSCSTIIPLKAFVLRILNEIISWFTDGLPEHCYLNLRLFFSHLKRNISTPIMLRSVSRASWELLWRIVFTIAMVAWFDTNKVFYMLCHGHFSFFPHKLYRSAQRRFVRSALDLFLIHLFERVIFIMS